MYFERLLIKFTRLSLIFLVCVLFATLLPGCEQRFQSKSRSLHNSTLRLGVALQATGALIFIALDQGFFNKEGLDLSMTTYPTGKRALQDGLLAGEVDIINSAEVPIAFSSFEHHDLGVLSSISTSDSVQKVIARRDAGISEVRDLNGKRIGTQKSSAVHFYWHLFHLLNNIKQFEMVYMRAEELTPSLIQGKIDAFSMREPYVGNAKELLGDNAIVFSERGIYMSSELVITTRAFAAKHPSIIEKFLKAMLRAEQFYFDNPELSFSIVANALKVDPAELTETWKRIKPQVRLDHAVQINLEEISTWAIEGGFVKDQQKHDIEDILAPSFLDKIDPERIGLLR
ncbi:ABC transporter substrate-binding protein [Maridesulfovibrio zosterae]|uniref:ABC transporter substrate-binding protein n=1 Tax=Maridesulfovibrio zosterae TaxID=82171 RepID=UPI00048339A3|nr:NrtA/SsuA/CpmA family ABC transporter substrate-binding protein [Maridesulfovibrio zosterae]